ncbi:MAG: hypothetical protein EOM59_10745 [Clostridia bacterium]|nr:hypothetical protein [Clostridia bacterium]
MRSIGKVKIRKLRALCVKYYDKMNGYASQEEIKRHVPDEWFDIWEGAWSEIERIIHDECTRIAYGLPEEVTR